ncbi:neutral amino acid transporter 9 [Anabrus simplex]|uniref:neutral amino acid transporter 9 n=1 Tax=Anabrus simplex TaxID=316456 RepID=UPI0034DD50B9
MLDKLEPKNYGWRSSTEQTDSDGESHPLLSSDTSQRSFGAPCMFPDSETSDFDTAPTYHDSRACLVRDTPRIATPARRPFHLQNQLDQTSDVTYNRFLYYNKLRAYAPNEESALVIPDHVIPTSVFVPYIPGQDQDTCKQSSLVTIFAVWNTIMGSSLLAMPWGLERAGFFTGIMIMILMGGLCLYTTYLLLQVQKRHGSQNHDGEVADLSRILLGRPAEVIAKCFSLIVLLGANIVYWILMSNFLYHSVDYIYERVTGVSSSDITDSNVTDVTVLCLQQPDMYNLSGSEVLKDTESTFHQVWDLHSTVPIFLILIIGPLVNFKSATFFTKFNSLGTLSVMYLLIFVIIKSASWGININFINETESSYAPSFLLSFPALSGMLALSFFIHNIIITIMRNNRNQEKNGRDLSIAFSLVTFTYVLIGTIFYVCFPLAKSCIEDNLLNNFQNWDVMTALARVFLFFQLVTVYPLIAYMLRVQVFTTLMKSVYPGFTHVALLNFAIIVICVLFAVFLPRIGTIIRFTGALSGLVYIFTLPCLLHLASLRKRNEMTCWSVIIHLAIPIIGGGNLIAQFFVSDH